MMSDKLMAMKTYRDYRNGYSRMLNGKYLSCNGNSGALDRATAIRFTVLSLTKYKRKNYYWRLYNK